MIATQLAVASPTDGRWSGSESVIEKLAKEAELAAAAKSPLALGRLYRLWNMNKLVERTPRVRAAIETIAATPRLDPLLEAHTKSLLAQLLMQQGKIAEARQLVKSIGLVTEAMLIGPFENSAGQGHEETYPPETEVRLDDEVEGKGHPVRWRELRSAAAGSGPSEPGQAGVADHGIFELAALLTPSSESTAYVLVAVEAPKPTQAALRFGASDQVAVFLDGEKIYALDSRRTAAFDQEAVTIALPKGSSLLMIKTSWVQSPGRLMFRLTKLDGSPLEGVTIRGDKTSIARAIAAKPALAAPPPAAPGPAAPATPATANQPAPPRATKKLPRPVAVGDALDAVIAKLGGTTPKQAARAGELADALALRADLAAVLSLFDRRKLPTPPELDLEAAIKLAPDNPTMRFFYAHRVFERDPTIAHEQLEQALRTDPGHVPSLLELAEMARGSGRTLEANQRLDEAIKKDPSFAAAHVARASLRFDVSLDRDLALHDLARAAEKLPAASLYGELARMRRNVEDRVGAKRDAKRALELDFTDAGSRSLLIGLALDAGDRRAALAAMDEALELYPFQLHARLRKVKLLAASKDEADRKIAWSMLDRAAKAFPDSVEIPNLSSELHLFDGQDKAALAMLEKSLELDPHQPEVRKHRGALAGEQRELEDEYTVDIKTLAALPVSEEEKSWGAIFLADRSAIRLYENGQSSRFQQTVLRLANPNFKDAIRVQRIPYSPSRELVEVLSAERIRPSGEIIKAEAITDDGPRGKVGGMYIDRRFKTIVFDDLDEGDMVNIRYRLDSVGSNMFGSFFGDVADLQSGLPKLNVLYTVIAPKSRPLYVGRLRAKEPERVEEGNLAKLIWSYDRLNAIEMEPFLPPYTELGTTISVSTYKSWGDLGRWYARLFSDQLELDAAARQAGKRVVAGAKDDAEKIRRLYDYVVKNTRYVGIELGIHGWKPFKASEVHRRRYGDCKDKATLLAALLRDNGVDATITLVRTSDRGELPEDHATMWAFNHAITFVPSQNLFLDGTAEFSGSLELPPQDQGAMSLIVYPDGNTKLTRLPESKPEDNLNSSRYQATIARDGALALDGVETFYGARASQLRQEMEEVEQRKSRLEKQLNQVFNGVRITELSFSDMSNLEAPVEYRYKSQIERYGSEEKSRYVIPLTLFQHQVASAYGQLAKRNHDLYVNHPWATRNVVSYQLPKGAVIESLPEGINIDTKHMALTQTVRRTPNGFETDDTVTMKTKRIPAADYPEFRQALLAIDRALGRKVVIRW